MSGYDFQIRQYEGSVLIVVDHQSQAATAIYAHLAALGLLVGLPRFESSAYFNYIGAAGISAELTCSIPSFAPSGSCNQPYIKVLQVFL